MKVLLLKDHPNAHDFLVKALEDQNFSVSLATYNESVNSLESSEDAEMVILDLKHPELNGNKACHSIRENNKFIPILVLSAAANVNIKAEVLDAGADDYMVEPFENIELLARVRALIRRNHFQQAKLYTVSDLELDAETKMVTRNGININLTTKEFDLLEYFFKNPGKVVTRRELAEKVWDTSFDGATNKIEVYINYLRKKIDKGFQGKLIHTVVGKGYLFKFNEGKSKK